MSQVIVAIPMGDPAGIGPEIVLKALASEELRASGARCLVVGDARVLRQAMGFPGLPQLELHVIEKVEEALLAPGTLELIDLQNADPKDFRVGEVSALCGRAAYEYIEKAVELALAGQADAVTTTCINKESLQAAGVPHIGHTEIFNALTHTEDSLTLFEVRNLRVFFLSRHVSLQKACAMVTIPRIVDYVKRCTAALARLGVTEGTMVVAGLNPHCGEHGLFGDEEERAVRPAVAQLQAEGYRVEGPIGADSVFHLALQGRYNSVLSLYHDQGHIATKTLDFERTISITAGLPILRTSVDHGTAFDIAGSGQASAVSLIEAVRLACKYAPFYR